MTKNSRKIFFLCLIATLISAGNAAAFPGLRKHVPDEETVTTPEQAPEAKQPEDEMTRKERELEEKLAEEAKPKISGKIVETMNSGGYTYVLLEKDDKKTWVATDEMAVNLGQELLFYCGNEMWDFRSKPLGRTFERIYFCGPPAKTVGGAEDGKMAGKVSAGSAGAIVAPTENIKVEKAAAGNAYTIAELYANKGKLDTKAVAVKGKVVKVSAGIMGKNWIHVQDGTGDAQKKTNNLVVTSQDIPEVGNIVTVNGVFKADRDFGSGYKYDAIVEDATITKDATMK